MDRHRLDRVAKSLAAGATRRQVLTGLGRAAFGGVVATVAAGLPDRASARRARRRRRCRATLGTKLVQVPQVFGPNRCSSAESRDVALAAIAGGFCVGQYDPGCAGRKNCLGGEGCKKVADHQSGSSGGGVGEPGDNPECPNDGRGWVAWVSGEFKCSCTCR